MNDIFIKRLITYHNCETCGSYSSTEIIVEQDGKVVLEMYEDDHLGGGDDLSDPIAVSFRILTALGLPVRIQDDHAG